MNKFTELTDGSAGAAIPNTESTAKSSTKKAERYHTVAAPTSLLTEPTDPYKLKKLFKQLSVGTMTTADSVP